MGRSSYTASERRGILTIAILALLLIGAGLGISQCHHDSSIGTNDITVIEEHPEMIDSVEFEKNSKAKNKKAKKTTNQTKKTKAVKTHRRRSPLDEPV